MRLPIGVVVSFFRDRQFATKLFAVVALMLIALIACAFWVSSAQRSAQSAMSAAAVQTQRAELLNTLERNVDAVFNSAAGYAMTGDPLFKAEYEESLAAQTDLLGELTNNLSESGHDPTQNAQVTNLLQTFESTYIEPLIAYAGKQVHAAKQISIAMDATQKANDVLVEAMKTIIVSEQDEAKELAAGASADTSRANLVAFLGPAAVALVALVGFGALALTTRRRLSKLQSSCVRIGSGQLDEVVGMSGRDEIGVLGQAVEDMRLSLRGAATARLEESAKQRLLADLGTALGGDVIATAAERVIHLLVDRVGAAQGVLYGVSGTNGDRSLRCLASHADGGASATIAFGEGLIGAAAETGEVACLSVPPDGLRVRSGLVDAAPTEVIIVPCVQESATKAVIELATLGRFTALHRQMLSQAADRIAIAISTLNARERIDSLLAESQAQAEELQTQTEELESQQDDLEASNSNLEAKQVELEEKNNDLALLNSQLSALRVELEQRADAVERASRYKSQFLANMSHELRTPLNSLLVLAETLAKNKAGNLTERQARSAETIYGAGKDLLALINEVLDLARVEAGRITLDTDEVSIADVTAAMERTFQPLAQQRGVGFEVRVGEDVPTTLLADRQRLDQILRNLIGNALKFTEAGTVTMSVRTAAVSSAAGAGGSTGGSASGAHDAAQRVAAVAFDVADTGIGMAVSDFDAAFEPFQQLEGGAARRFGGTGLGLAISRELARAMGGDIDVSSELGVGSTFTLYVPTRPNGTPPTQTPVEPGAGSAARAPLKLSPRAVDEARDVGQESAGAASSDVGEADTRGPRDARLVMIVEDDPQFAAILADQARDHGFEAVVAATGTEAISTAKELVPDAVTLDLSLPDIDGWVVFDRLRRSPELRHIPVQIISGRDEARRGVAHGAIGYLTKPADLDDISAAFDRMAVLLERSIGRILIIEDDPDSMAGMVAYLDGADVEIVTVANGMDGITALEKGRFDCVVMDLGLPDISGFDLISRIRESDSYSDLPILIYTGRELSSRDLRILETKADVVIQKDPLAPARLLDETSLFLHRVAAQMPAERSRVLRDLYATDPILAGHTVLIVDDDSRNVFALANVLEDHGMVVVDAENGQIGLGTLATNRDIDIVLMDIMMPVMDGYEAIRAIRADKSLAKLPVIALTALAMPEDRQRSLDAGANEYMHKPVDPEQLVSLLRVWLQS